MAMAPPRPCASPKCGRINCTRHKAAPWRTVERPIVTRIRGRELQRRREGLFAREPWCRTCAQEGRRTRATVRDHIVPLAESGTEDETNIQPLCIDCSDAKTERESKRGVCRSQMTNRFRKSATPRDHAGQFTVRRETRSTRDDHDPDRP